MGPFITDFENSKIGVNFRHILTTRGDIAKLKAPIDSARQIGLNMLLNEVLNVGKGSMDSELKFVKSGTILLITGEAV